MLWLRPKALRDRNQTNSNLLSPVEPSSQQLRQHYPRLRPQRKWTKGKGVDDCDLRGNLKGIWGCKPSGVIQLYESSPFSSPQLQIAGRGSRARLVLLTRRDPLHLPYFRWQEGGLCCLEHHGLGSDPEFLEERWLVCSLPADSISSSSP